MGVRSAKDLEVYRTAYALAMSIFNLSREWPKVEMYSLTDQIRRSSRAVCANLREAWGKRCYESHFVSKLTDCDAENAETDTWLDFARDSGYLTMAVHAELVRECRKVGAMLGKMLLNPTPFLLTPDP